MKRSAVPRSWSPPIATRADTWSGPIPPLRTAGFTRAMTKRLSALIWRWPTPDSVGNYAAQRIALRQLLRRHRMFRKDVEARTVLGKVMERVGSLEDQDGEKEHGAEVWDHQETTGDAAGNQDHRSYTGQNDKGQHDLEQDVQDEVPRVFRDQG